MLTNGKLDYVVQFDSIRLLNLRLHTITSQTMLLKCGIIEALNKCIGTSVLLAMNMVMAKALGHMMVKLCIFDDNERNIPKEITDAIVPPRSATVRTKIQTMIFLLHYYHKFDIKPTHEYWTRRVLSAGIEYDSAYNVFNCWLIMNAYSHEIWKSS